MFGVLFGASGALGSPALGVWSRSDDPYALMDARAYERMVREREKRENFRRHHLWAGVAEIPDLPA